MRVLDRIGEVAKASSSLAGAGTRAGVARITDQIYESVGGAVFKNLQPLASRMRTEIERER